MTTHKDAFMTLVVEQPEPLSRRAKSQAATRQRIVEAAETLFGAAGGYEAATIRTIAKAAGFSTGAVFGNFDDKAALYREIYGHPPVTPEQGRDLVALLLNVLEDGVGSPASGAAEDFLRDHQLLPAEQSPPV